MLTPNAQVDIQRGQIVLSGQRGVPSNINVSTAAITTSRSSAAFEAGLNRTSRRRFLRRYPRIPGHPRRLLGRVWPIVWRDDHCRDPVGGQPVNGLGILREPPCGLQPATSSVSGLPDPAAVGRISARRSARSEFFFGAYEQQAVGLPAGGLFDALRGLHADDRTREAFDYFKSLEEPFTQTNDAVTGSGSPRLGLAREAAVGRPLSGSRNVGLNAVSPGNPRSPTDAVACRAAEQNGSSRHRRRPIHQRSASIRLVEIRGQDSAGGEAPAMRTPSRPG